MTRSLCLLLLIACPMAVAGEIVLYRCTGADGSLSIQDEPCARGQSQEVRRYEAPPPPPRPAPAAQPQPEPEPELPGLWMDEDDPAHPFVNAVPVPALYQCRTFDGQDYVSEFGGGNRRCVPLTITRIGSAPTPGMASACEWVVDECRELLGGEACSGWRNLHRQAVRAEREAFSDTLAEARSELARLGAIRDAACAAVGTQNP